MPLFLPDFCRSIIKCLSTSVFDNLCIKEIFGSIIQFIVIAIKRILILEFRKCQNSLDLTWMLQRIPIENLCSKLKLLSFFFLLFLLIHYYNKTFSIFWSTFCSFEPFDFQRGHFEKFNLWLFFIRLFTFFFYHFFLHLSHPFYTAFQIHIFFLNCARNSRDCREIRLY